MAEVKRNQAKTTQKEKRDQREQLSAALLILFLLIAILPASIDSLRGNFAVIVVQILAIVGVGATVAFLTQSSRRKD